MIFRKQVKPDDYKVTYLPKNRIESIKDVLSLQWLTLLKLGLVLLLFSAPIIVHQILLNISIYEIELAYRLGHITRAYAEQALSETFNLGHFIRIPLLILFGFGLSGILRVIRQLIFQEPVFFFDDFKKGIFAHRFYVSLSMFLLGLSYYVFHTIIRSGYFLDDSLTLDIGIVLSLVLLLTIILISLFVISQTTLYQLKLRAIYKNALLFMMRYFFPTLGLVALVFSPWLLMFLPLGSFFIIVFMLLFILMPFGILILLEYTYHIYDQTINRLHYKEIYKKGIYHA